MASPPAWLQDIQFITFDCFGTLFDLRTALEKVEIRTREDHEAFEREAAKLQDADSWVRYVDVLKGAIGKVRPQLRPAIIGLFADDFGRMAAFPDAVRSFGTLKDVVKVGVVTSGDASHQLDVIASLKVAPDVSITSQEIRAYKPADRAWDAIVRIGVARSAATRDSWLHVASSSRSDLVPARARGLKTCLVKRPHGEEKATVDLTVTSLDELVSLVLEAKQGPLVVEVESTCEAGLQPRLKTWLLQQHLPAMRAVPGVRSSQLVERDDGALLELHVFGGRGEYENYVAGFAAEHRAALRDEFGRAVERTTRVGTLRGRL